MRTGFRLTHVPLAALWRLGATSLGLLLAVVATDRLLGSLIEKGASWRSSQDPRERILWDSQFDGSPEVLIGDSEFSSMYVDSPQETLWARLSARSGKKVFPAGLVGANPADMLLVAKRVAALWPSGTTAFIGINPIRIFVPHATSLPRTCTYCPQLRLLVDYHYANEGWPQRVEGRLIFELGRRSFLTRNQGWILRYLKARLKGEPEFFSDSSEKNRTWNVDGSFALDRFRSVEAHLFDRVVPLSWVRSLADVLGERGITPVFVLLPLNVALIRQYSDGRLPTEQILTASHDYLVRELLASGFRFVDVFRELDSSSFADLLHTNSRGDDAIAGALSDWLMGRRLTYNSGSQDLGAHRPHQDY